MQITNSINVTGQLRDIDSKSIKTTKFLLEDSNQNRLAKGTTDKKGRFEILLPAE